MKVNEAMKAFLEIYKSAKQRQIEYGKKFSDDVNNMDMLKALEKANNDVKEISERIAQVLLLYV